MTAIKTLTAVAAATLTLAAAGVASAQTPYSQTPYGQQPSQGGQVLEAILGALFGNGQTSLDSEWSRGRRPLYNQRAQFETRVDAGVRDGSLSRRQAERLRADYADLVALETRFAADGRFTTAERTELNDRYRDLTRRLDSDDYDNDDDYDRWERLADQTAAFDARVAAALRAREISRTESTRLRADFQALVRLEAQYERDGLSQREREDLETRYADLNRRVGDDYVPGNGGGGYGDPHAMQIEARIAAGLRDGSITRADAARYREELRDLSRRWADLEARVSVRR